MGLTNELFSLPVRPKLADLKSRECNVQELQAALVHLIDLYNEQGKLMDSALHELMAYRDSRRRGESRNMTFDI